MAFADTTGHMICFIAASLYIFRLAYFRSFTNLIIICCFYRRGTASRRSVAYLDDITRADFAIITRGYDSVVCDVCSAFLEPRLAMPYVAAIKRAVSQSNYLFRRATGKRTFR